MIKIDNKSKTIDIYNVGCYTKDSSYWISFERFNTPQKLQEWVQHLSQKNWFNLFLEEELKRAYRIIN